MSLRIHNASESFAPTRNDHKNAALALMATDKSGDDWGTRLAKLIPAEALGLYGSVTALVPKISDQFPASSRTVTLWVLALVCILFSAVIRWKATAEGGKPQIPAIAIAIISFLIWLLALGAPNSPIVLPDGYTFVGPVVALLWATIASYFYHGDAG